MIENNTKSYDPGSAAAFRTPDVTTRRREPFSHTAAEVMASARVSLKAAWELLAASCKRTASCVPRLLPNWPLAWARTRYLAFLVLTKPFFALIYFTMIAEGMRVVIPSSALKLYKVPGLGALQTDAIGYRLDVAHFLSIALLLAAWFFAEKALLLWLHPGDSPESGYDYDNYRRLITVLATMVIGGDALMFYVSVTEMGWGGTVISFTAFVATCAYLGALMFVSLASVNLKKKINDLREEKSL